MSSSSIPNPKPQPSSSSSTEPGPPPSQSEKLRGTWQHLVPDLRLHLTKQRYENERMLLLAKKMEFKPFPRLPVELRLRIWKLAARSEPRVVEIAVDVESKEWYSPWETRHPPCPLLAANSEANQAYHEIYKVICRIGPPSGRDRAPCYFNDDMDTLLPRRWFTRWTATRVMPSFHTLSNFKILAVNESDFVSAIRSSVGGEGQHWFLDWLKHFPHLEMLIIFVGDKDDFDIYNPKKEAKGVPGFVAVPQKCPSRAEMDEICPDQESLILFFSLASVEKALLGVSGLWGNMPERVMKLLTRDGKMYDLYSQSWHFTM